MDLSRLVGLSSVLNACLVNSFTATALPIMVMIIRTVSAEHLKSLS